jgi:hypothetical protein
MEEAVDDVLALDADVLVLVLDAADDIEAPLEAAADVLDELDGWLVPVEEDADRALDELVIGCTRPASSLLSPPPPQATRPRLRIRAEAQARFLR